MDCKDIHFEILNLVLKVIHNSWYYCFCNKYSGCKDCFGTKEYCAICRIAVDFNDIERIFSKRDRLKFFNQNYRWTHRDYQDANRYEMSMQEIINNSRYLSELNGPERFLLLLTLNTVLSLG